MSTLDTHLTPSETTVSSPALISLNPELPVTVTDKEAKEAAQSLGMKFFSPEKTRMLRQIGAFRAQQGVVHLGVGRLAACDEALQRLLDTAVEIAADGDQETNVRVGAILAGKGVVETMQKGIAMEAEFQVDKLIGGAAPSKKRSFDSDAPIIPITATTVNINVDEKRPLAEATAATPPSL